VVDTKQGGLWVWLNRKSTGSTVNLQI
jgi:hypothetical protein